MSSDLRIYQVGVTQFTVGLSALLQVSAPRGVMGWQFKNNGSSLAIANGTSAANGFSLGYLLGASEIIQLQGPATFFLAAAGATTVLSALAFYSAGYSLYP